MAQYLNINIPHFYCKLRLEYLYNLEEHFNEFIDVCVFAIASDPGRALGFHVLTDAGAQFARLPITALVHKEDAPTYPLDFLQLWDCFSYEASVTEFSYLAEKKVFVTMKDKTIEPGEYMFTVDFMNNAWSSEPSQHKNLHIIALENGCFAAQPNNRLRWVDPSFVLKPFPSQPDYRLNTHKWICEHNPKWRIEDTDKVFYDIYEAKE